MKLKIDIGIRLAVLTILGFGAHTNAGQEGSGGAGVHRNGRYMTFYSAGFYTNERPETVKEVPQLEQLIHFINYNQFISPTTKSTIANSLIPSNVRQYFRIRKEAMTPQVRERLLAEYARVMNVDLSEVAVFAITDTHSKTTYLMPEFYTLNQYEQKAILFHEGFWINNPKSDYRTVVDAEMAFQGYLENSNSPEFLMAWLHSVGSPADRLIAAIRLDMSSGALQSVLVDGKKLTMGTLLGDDYFTCRAREETYACMGAIGVHLYQLGLQLPNSMLVNLMRNSAAKNYRFAEQPDHFFSLALVQKGHNALTAPYGYHGFPYLIYRDGSNNLKMTVPAPKNCFIDITESLYASPSFPLTCYETVEKRLGRETTEPLLTKYLLFIQ